MLWNTFEADRALLKAQYDAPCGGRGTDVGILREKVAQIVGETAGCSPMTVKAECLSFVMRNMKVEICPQEFFADRFDHGNIMQDFFWHRADFVRERCPENAAADRNSRTVGAVWANMDFSHISPDWSFVLGQGIPGILARLKEQRALHADVPEKVVFYDGCIKVYEAFIALLLRFADAAEECGTEKARFAAENLRALTRSAPRTLAQAMQLTLLFYRIETDLDQTTVRSLGGLDRLYAPFYRSDLASGRFTEANLRELTDDFLWKISVMGTAANLPFYIGGKDDAGHDACNEYTRVLLEEYRRLDIYDPKIHVMYHGGFDRELLDLILTMIREGKNSFVFINTDAAEHALEQVGIAPEDARHLTVYGCYEAAAEGTEVPATCGGNINLAKAVELALNNGTDPVTGIAYGPETGTDFDDFDAFLKAVGTQVEYIAVTCMDTIAEYERHYGECFATPVISATFASSAENGRDLYAGGAKYNNTSVVGAGLATLVDSVMTVKRTVFDEKTMTLSGWRECLAADWNGWERLRAECLGSGEKYGNNLPDADRVTTELFEAFANKINLRKNGRGGVFRCGMFSVDWRFWMGKVTGATPDGRRRGTPLSKNTAASVGQDRAGVTALLQTMLKLDSGKIPDGYVADVVLHESAVAGEDGFAAFRGLLLAFLRAGGFSVHFNVLDPDVLRRAQKQPEQYRNLQIRLCGWDVYFVDLTKEEQDEFILQASRGS